MCENYIKYPLWRFGVFPTMKFAFFYNFEGCKLYCSLFFDVKKKYINLKIVVLQYAEVPENAFNYR